MQSISAEQVSRRIAAENPWWTESGPVAAPFSGLKPRLYLELLYPLIESFEPHRAVVLLGPRRVGKTVILHHAIQKSIESGTNPKSICYISVDHPIYDGFPLEELLNRASAAADKDFSSGPAYLFLDEIQYLRDWQRHLKAMVDRHPQLKCVVSGSAAAALERGSRESGAGRFTDFFLPPLTFHEYLELSGKSSLISVSGGDAELEPKFSSSDITALNREFIDYINYGGYPEVIFSDKARTDPGRFIKSDIVDKVLLRDLPQLYGIRDIQELNHLFTTLALNTANEVSLEALSKNSGVAKNTIKRYIEYLEAAFLIRVLHRIDQRGKRFKRANYFKVYLTNPSMQAALFSPAGPSDPAIGHLVETAILSQWFHNRSSGFLTYARWKSGEVDIVGMESGARPQWAVEVKWSDRPVNDPREIENVLSFCHANRVHEALVTTLTSRDRKMTNGVKLEFLPASLYCFAVGYNIVKHKGIGIRLLVPEPAGDPPKAGV